MKQMAPFVELLKLSREQPSIKPPRSVYGMTGRLERSASGWGLLVVPNAILNGVFASLQLPGVERPRGPSGRVNAHISVFRKEELQQAETGGKVTEFGKRYKFQPGELMEVNPVGWDEMEKCWFLQVRSPELEKLRKSYGLSPLPEKNGVALPFHLTVAVRRKGVLNRNSMKKTSGVNWLMNPDELQLSLAK